MGERWGECVRSVIATRERRRTQKQPSERVAQRKKMAKREGASTSSLRPRKKAAKEGRDAREAENGQRLLEKLPPEVLEKILDELDENDLLSLALSCKYFRQKQKELVARTRQSGKRRLALKTTFHHRPEKAFGQPVSAEFLRFCSKAEVPKNYVVARAASITRQAAYHG